MEQLSEEARFLATHKIKTFEELSNYQDDINFKIKEILDQRERLWAKRKLSKDGNEMHEYAEQISSLNDKLIKLRKRVELCEDIKTRVPKIDNNLSELDTQEEMEKETKDVDIREMVAEWLWKELKENCGMRGPVYVGRIYADPMEICRSFIEAAALADDYRILGNRHFLLFEEIQGEETQTQYPVLEQAVYIQCLKQANEKAALEALHNMIHEIEKLKSFVMMQCLCFDIINVAIRTLDSMKGFEIQNLDMKKLCTFGSLPEFEEKVSALTVQICQQYSKFKTKQNDQLKAEILNYVNGHYGDCGMGLDLLSEQFGISVNQLSRFFKQETGCTFIQYITMLRMDKARELLMNTDIPVKDIVAQIGYIDAANFVRKFKGYEGITPGQYREKMRKKEL